MKQEVKNTGITLVSDMYDAMTKHSKAKCRTLKLTITDEEGTIHESMSFEFRRPLEAHLIAWLITKHRDFIESIAHYMWRQEDKK